MEIILFVKVNVCQQVCIAEVRKVLACPITGQDWINFSNLSKSCMQLVRSFKIPLSP